jgi:cysteine desulfurase
MSLYLDSAASAPPTPDVIARMAEVERDLPANPSSAHQVGQRAARAIERTRGQLATHLSCEPDQVVFTGGATEANNLAIQGALHAAQRAASAGLHPRLAPGARPHVVASAVEHPSVRGLLRALAERRALDVDWLPVDREGRALPEELHRLLRPETVLVSVMHVNNEVGTTQPLARIGKVCRAHRVLFHSDATQSFMKLPTDVDALQVDLLTVGAHKLHGPKGVGALYVRPGVRLEPLIFGGGHEGGLRPGTLNTAAIAGFGAAIDGFTVPEAARVLGVARAMRAALLARFPGLQLWSPDPGGVGTILAVGLPPEAEGAPRRASQVAAALSRHGVQVSASAACCAGAEEISHVHAAMGLRDEQARATLRISVGRGNTSDDVPRLIAALEQALDGPAGGRRLA